MLAVCSRPRTFESNHVARAREQSPWYDQHDKTRGVMVSTRRHFLVKLPYPEPAAARRVFAPLSIEAGLPAASRDDGVTDTKFLGLVTSTLLLASASLQSEKLAGTKQRAHSFPFHTKSRVVNGRELFSKGRRGVVTHGGDLSCAI